MPTSRWISAVALLFTTASATFTLPAPNTSWDVNSQHEISWDTKGLKGPLQLHLAPGGKSYDSKYSDYSSYIGTLAPSIPNVGKWQWYPSMSIPQHHSSYIIIIIDSGGHYQYSPPFSMIGWPQMPGHTPPYVYSQPPHTMPPSEVSTAAPIQLEPSAVIITSIHVTEVVRTSQPPPMIKTIERPPLIETMEVAPVIMTQMQDAITMTVTQPFLFSTEYPAPIVKCVTEILAPIIHTVSQPPKIIIETRAPIIITEIKAPIIKTIYQEPEIMTEILAPILITSEVTKVHELTSFVNVAPINTMAPVHSMAPVLVSVYPTKAMHSSAAAYPAYPAEEPAYEEPSYEQPSYEEPAYTPDAITPTSVIIPSVFPNSSAIEIPAFTTPLALLATNPAVTTSSSPFVSVITPSFTPNAGGRSSAISVGLMSGLMALVMFSI